MISKRIECKPENDNYRRLAKYIADADHEGEKSLMSWCSGCSAGDDYELAIQEIVDKQSLNTRSQKEKTYHLVISFRPEDEHRLNPEDFKKIEEDFAKALGFGEHQRHCGVHKNTNNLHMHVAYNMIHPEKLTRHEPFRDYWTRDRICREVERGYGLIIDNGRDIQKPENERLTQKAARMEAHTGQQSFEHYVKERHERIMSSLDSASSWQYLHKALATFGIGIKPHGNGLVIADLEGKTAMKASTLDRAFSLKKLESLLGKFEAADPVSLTTEARERYQSEPLHRAPERGQLFAEYKAGIDSRKMRLRIIKEDESDQLEAVKRKWEKKRADLLQKPLPRKSRARLLNSAKLLEKEEKMQFRAAVQARRETVKEEIPYASWAEFLRRKAVEGNEIALAILRSRKEEVEAEERDAGHSLSAKREIQEKFARKEKAIMESTKLRDKTKRLLLSIEKMNRLAAEETALSAPDNKAVFAGVTYEINARGVIIYHLSSGGTVRDTGKEIHFSAHDDAASAAASRYAKEKWGKEAALDGNTIRKPLGRKQKRQLEKMGISR